MCVRFLSFLYYNVLLLSILSLVVIARLNWEVLLCGAEHFWRLGLQELLLFEAVVNDLLALLAGDACHDWSLSGV